eukprot:m.1639264 g.1639264  ORF g.1639264 m.1639264 type:complete len:80 (-) comp34183_c0_seq1:163-402(-)
MGSRVTGEVPWVCNHLVIAFRSYDRPSGAMTGSDMISIVILHVNASHAEDGTDSMPKYDIWRFGDKNLLFLVNLIFVAC